MVKIRKKPEGGITWVLEGETLPERLEEFATIFNFHARESGGTKLDPRFTAELLELQTRAMVQMARAQETELKRLRELEREFALFRAEILAEVKTLRNPPSSGLDKPKLKAPKKPDNKG